MDIVLESIKKLIGFTEEYDAFNTDLTIYINSALDTIVQLGGKVKGRLTIGGSETWSDIFDESTDLEMMKVYIYLRCRLVFDPPINASVLESIKEQIKEYEYRINLEIEYNNATEEEGGVDPTNG